MSARASLWSMPAWSIAMKMVFITMQSVMNRSRKASIINNPTLSANLYQAGQHSHSKIRLWHFCFNLSFALKVCIWLSEPEMINYYHHHWRSWFFSRTTRAKKKLRKHSLLWKHLYSKLFSLLLHPIIPFLLTSSWIIHFGYHIGLSFVFFGLTVSLYS